MAKCTVLPVLVITDVTKWIKICHRAYETDKRASGLNAIDGA